MADSIFVRLMNRVGDIMLLSVIFTLFCIPFITIGPAITAASYVGIKAIEQDDGYVWRRFWKSFKKNFKQSIIAWLITVAILAILAVDIQYWYTANKATPSTVSQVLLVISIILLVCFLLTVIHVFPLIGNYENKVGKMFENGALISLTKFPLSFVILLIYAATVWFLWGNTPFLLIFFMFGAGLIIFICSAIHRVIFRSVIKNAEKAREEIAREKAEAEAAENGEYDEDSDEDSEDDNESDEESDDDSKSDEESDDDNESDKDSDKDDSNSGKKRK